ncbi:sugar kinase [Roseibium aggregatum]|uniref:Sugar kinase n=1 Tax=Roseibium aggregatum TaxID=187304 RepID=A0A939EE07_9HYPH|nr:sugar kinase [Roseibium aggregatum]MBN9671536.1 sugar kinase [Roseibium aggregatum]
MQPDIVCLGEPMLEFNEQGDGRFLKGHGGDTSNAAIAAARQGASVGYLTRVGSDAFGEDFLRLWQSEQVDTSQIPVDSDAPTGVYFVSHDASGHSFTYRRKGSAASLITPADLSADYIAGARILHVSGISQAISETAADTVFKAIEVCRNAGGWVSYDTNLRLNLWPLERARAVTHAAMAKAHIALPGLEDAVQLTGLTDPDEIADFYLALGCEIVALTLGKDGTLIALRDERRRVPGLPVTPVDATAAGDTFDGAFLAEMAAGRDPYDAARYANAAAALSTQGYGAVAPMPRRDDVEQFLKTGRAA